MGFIEGLFGEKEESTASTEIIIPEHRLKKLAEEARKKRREEAKREEEKKTDETEKKKKKIIYSGTIPLIEIIGFFGVGGIAMLKAKVMRGRIKPKGKIQCNKKKFKITEIRKNSQKVPMLIQGETGTLFLNSAKSFTFKEGDLVEIV